MSRTFTAALFRLPCLALDGHKLLTVFPRDTDLSTMRWIFNKSTVETCFNYCYVSSLFHGHE